jgi:transposase
LLKLTQQQIGVKEMIKIKGYIRDLWAQVARLEDNQIIQMSVPTLSQAKNLMRQLKAARKVCEEEGILDVPVEIRQEESNGQYIIQIYKEKPVYVELVEIDETGKANIKKSVSLADINELQTEV